MADHAKPSALTIEIHRSGKAAVVRCSGRLVAGVNDVLYTEVRRLMPETKRIVLDLTDLKHVDSMGIGTLARLYVHSRSVDCSLELINLGQKVRQLLGMTNLLSVFTIIVEHNIRF